MRVTYIKSTYGIPIYTALLHEYAFYTVSHIVLREVKNNGDSQTWSDDETREVSKSIAVAR